MLIKTIVITPFAQNARLLIDEQSRRSILVDPGGDVEILSRLIRESEATLDAVFLTHAHIDHAGGVRGILDQWKTKTGEPIALYGHRADKGLRSAVAQQAAFFGLSPEEYRDCPEPDQYIDEGDSVSVGDLRGEVRFVPGHAPGHVVWFFPSVTGESQWFGAGPRGQLTIQHREKLSGPVLIGGDTLFQGSIGRTDLPGGDHDTLLRCIRERIFTLPPDTKVLTGHGEDTTVGEEMRTNPFFGR